MNITNNTPKPFPIATGVTLEPNETRYLRNWAAISEGNPVIAAWVKYGLITAKMPTATDMEDMRAKAEGIVERLYPKRRKKK